MSNALGQKIKSNASRLFGGKSAKSGAAAKPRRGKSKHPVLKFILRAILTLFILGIVAAVVLYFWKIAPLIKDLPSPDNLTTGNDRFSVASQVFDRNGKKLYEFYEGERRIPVDINDLPDYVAQASIAIEDRRFYKHHGFDVNGIIRAFVENQSRGGYAQGGSTITQQLMKKAFLTDEKSYERKIKEIVLSVVTEMRYNKEQILNMYLNYISYGGTAVGIGSAAETYFEKNAQDLTLAEASMLAGLPQAPSRYSPLKTDKTAAKNRQKEVLGAMVELEFITQAEADAAFAEELKFSDKGIDLVAPHFVFYVRDLLNETYGKETVDNGGLRITTTLDLELQEAAQASLSAEIETLEKYDVSNGAAVITKPDTGEVLAMVGSTDYFDTENDGQVNVVTSLRQPGSSIKPLVYATAFEQRLLSPGSIILDIPTCFQVLGQPDYCPKNYDGSFHGPVTIRQSLANSYNIPAVKTLRMVGLESMIDQTTEMGISTWLKPQNYGWSLALGGGDVRMIDMAQAFGALANEGVKVPLTSILEVKDYQGKVLAKTDLEERKRLLGVMQANPESSYEDVDAETTFERVMSPAATYMTANIMRDNNARAAAFGTRSELYIKDKDVAAKTGTTNDLRDNWTVGFTPEYLVITWVGNNDSSQMNPYLVSGVTGAAPIWNDIMSYVLSDNTPVWHEAPEDVKEGMVCATGMPPREEQAGATSETQQQCDENGENCHEVPSDNAGCGTMHKDIYWEEAMPTRSVVVRESAWVSTATGVPPTKEGEGGDLVAEDHLFYKDPLTDYYCVDCNRPVDENGKVSYEQHYIGEEMGVAMYGD